MTIEQIRTILLAIPNQDAEIRTIAVETTERGDEYLEVTFADGFIADYDADGKPVIRT